jgi:hypothetical protein
MANSEGVTYREQWQEAAIVLREHANKLDALAGTAPPRPTAAADAMKVAVCEYLLQVNRHFAPGPFIPPTAINWLGDGIVSAIEASQTGRGS